MRKIRFGHMIVFLGLLSAAIGLSVLTTWGLLGKIFLGDFRGITLLFAGVFFLYAYGIMVYRSFLFFSPIGEGEVAEGSRQEFTYQVHALFNVILFHSITHTGILPIPLMRLFYQALGARLGRNTFSSGVIADPIFVEIGNDTTVGDMALLVPHVIEGRKLAHYRIRIGNNVTVGAGSRTMPGVTIGDNAIVAMGAVVPKGTVIGPGEIWGGVPARKISMVKNELSGCVPECAAIDVALNSGVRSIT
jgi:serine acetyltransferase